MQDHDGYRSRCRWIGCVLICVRKTFSVLLSAELSLSFQMDPIDADIRDSVELNAFWGGIHIKFWIPLLTSFA